ncbi:MAG TPA: phosphate ABC transporter permease PstA [Candidatus Limnocylindria bacterium]|nr:phosphate ABC transporter permease PstA [Candidatus Limnocylindria bacterium]
MTTPRAEALTGADLVRRAISGQRSDPWSRVFEALLGLAVIVSLGVLAWLLAVVFVNGTSTLVERGLDFFTAPATSQAGRAGVAQGIIGSLYLMAFVAVIAFPLGVGAAIYLEEYSRDTRFSRLVNTVVRNLAGVPSIVYGLLGLAVFVVALRDVVGANASGRSLIAGGLTMAILVLPIVIITTAESLRAVPTAIREAAFGVGATRWEVVRSHVLPYAAPGILTGTILSMARAFGETAPLILVGAVVGTFNVRNETVWDQLQGRYTALPTIIYDWARKPGDFAGNTYAAIIVLLVALLLVNALAIVLRSRFERRW